MVVFTSIFLASLFALVSAKPAARSGMVVRSSREAAPAAYAHQGPAPADQMLALRIALVQKDMAGLEKALYDVSTPGSENYGNHLSKTDVSNLSYHRHDSY